MNTSKVFFTSGLVFAYLLVGSGRYVAQRTKSDARQVAKDFAATLPRKVYRYSVVPGGVNSPEELERARRNDPVVAAHFADFGKNTRMTTLKEDMYVYVSYRQGNKVYYSKKKHKVCAGEVVITDGKNLARARCANRLTKVFRPPAVAFDEPTAPQFDYIDPPASPDVVPEEPLLTSGLYGLPDGTNYAPPVQAAQTGANPGPPLPEDTLAGGTSGVILPAFAPYAAGAPGFFVPLTPLVTPPPVTPPPVVPPPVTVPEPAEWRFLLLVGSAMVLMFRKKKNQSN